MVADQAGIQFSSESKMRPLFITLFVYLLSSGSAAFADNNGISRSGNKPWVSPLQQDHALAGKIFEPDSGRQISEAALFETLATTDVIVLGEKHDNPDHHLIQARVIRELGPRPVVFEQIVATQQDAIDDLLSATPRECSLLPEVLKWKGNGWPSWSIYRPVFEAACDSGADIVAGSMTRKQTREVSRKGLAALDPGLVVRFRLGRALPEKLSETLMTELEAAHCHLMPPAMLEPMQMVQRSRDAYLAAAVARLLPQRAFVVTGNGHGVNDLGVPALLKQAGQRSVVSIALLEVRPEKLEIKDYTGAWFREQLPFDYVWFTPQANEKDHCAELKSQLSSHGKIQ